MYVVQALKIMTPLFVFLTVETTVQLLSQVQSCQITENFVPGLGDTVAGLSGWASGRPPPELNLLFSRWNG